MVASHSFYSCISKTTERESIPVTAVNNIDPYTMIVEGQALLQQGDLVVRLNQDPASQFIKNFNRQDKSYSHAGIVLFENGYPFVYHIVNTEKNQEEKLRKDSLSGFCNPRKNLAYAIYRYEFTEGEIRKLKTVIHKWYAEEVKFDLEYDLKTDNRMYCSEMIRNVLARATGKRILIETTKLTNREAGLFSVYTHLPFTYTSKLQIVSIDNLYKNAYCRLIKKYSY